MKLLVRHTTRYDYETPVHFALQRVKLRPLDWPLQKVMDWTIEVDGGRIETSYYDHYGNHVDLVSVAQGSQSVSITAAGTVETFDNAGVLGPVYGRAPLWHFEQHTAATKPGPKIEAIAETVKSGRNEVESMHALSAAILEAVPYEKGHTAFETPAEQAIEIGKGVCQDHANIFIAAVRHAGYPARYVSGYLMMDDCVDQDASHAWAEVHLSGLGWVGFDVSNGVCPDPRYIRIAIGRDAHDAAPIYGLRGGQGDESLIVSLQVQQ